MRLSRRTFLANTGVSVAFAGFAAFAACTPRPKAFTLSDNKYGPLKPDPKNILDLPKGFKYHIISTAGDEMQDGLLVPGLADGMAAFAAPNGQTILLRNHEVGHSQMALERPPHNQPISPFGLQDGRLSKIDQGKLYDHGGAGRQLCGGVTSVLLGLDGLRVEKQELALGGTFNNCAGGPTPWNSWISCEETTVRANQAAGLMQDHGYVFEVKADPHSGLQQAVPLRAMGRFSHEAAAVDPRTSIVYLTQDDITKPNLLYRFIPKVAEKLHLGGQLQALAIVGAPARDLRNWPESQDAPVSAGNWMNTHWIDLDDVDNPNDDLEQRGLNQGAAHFTRGEGIWFGDNEIYFTCTNGGAAKAGQIWRYIPSPVEGTSKEDDQPGRLQLFVESPNTSVMEYVDNITIAPWGDLIVCEDGIEGDNFLRGITQDGHIYTLARSALEQKNEFCGACFGPDGNTLYVNLQQDGLTLAIRGPWRGPWLGV